MVNSVFDPLGFLSPVTVQGKALLRELTAESSGKDEPLPEDKLGKWQAWQDLHIPRTSRATSLTEQCVNRSVCSVI